MSVIFCHLFMATCHVFSPVFRQLRSMTSLFLSLPSAFNTASNLSWLNLPSGNKYDVTMTYQLLH